MTSPENPKAPASSETLIEPRPDIRYNEGNGRWLTSWRNNETNPVDFFQDAQQLIDSLSLDTSNQTQPLISRRNYLFMQSSLAVNSEPVLIEMDRFEEPEAWKSIKPELLRDILRSAILVMNGINFTWERGSLSISSSLNRPNDFTRFIENHSKNEIDREFIEERLAEYGKLAQARQLDLISQKP